MPFYALYQNDQLVHITESCPWTGTPALAVIHDEKGNVVEYNSVKDRHEFESFEEVEQIAAFAKAKTGKNFMASESGEGRGRFDVFVGPTVGDVISKGFNGDYYPVGTIKRITPGGMVIAEDEDGHVTKFNRKKNSAGWKEVGGHSWMVGGTVDRRNPEF